MAKRKQIVDPIPPSQFWRVNLTCLGVFADSISVVIPMWDTTRFKNRVFLYYKKDMPSGFIDKIKIGTEFEGEVPMICHTQAEFSVRKVEIPK